MPEMGCKAKVTDFFIQTLFERERITGIHRTTGCVDPIAGLDVVE
jgi:hypothetical protein